MRLGDIPSSIQVSSPSVGPGQNFSLDVTLGSSLPAGDYAVRAFAVTAGGSTGGPNASGALPLFPVTLTLAPGQTKQVPLGDTVTSVQGKYVFDLVRSADVGNYNAGVEICSGGSEQVGPG